MELRVLHYFLAIAREKSMTHAAETLHITQPTLSRQVADLEAELGAPLFIRGKRKMLLTEAGVALERRAREILALAECAKNDIYTIQGRIGGDVHIGCAESLRVRYVAQTIQRVKCEHPSLCFHMQSGNSEDLLGRLDKGLLDFAVLIEPPTLKPYYALGFPEDDYWGLLMRKEDPLAQKNAIEAKDLENMSVIASKQALETKEFHAWFGEYATKLHIAATYNLPFNAILLVEAGVAPAFLLDELYPAGNDSPFAFRPLYPPVEARVYLLWRSEVPLSKPAQLFLEMFTEVL